jgi:hypothetical protein
MNRPQVERSQHMLLTEKTPEANVILRGFKAMHDAVNSTRRELLTALAMAMAAPLVGCGGGVSPSRTGQTAPPTGPASNTGSDSADILPSTVSFDSTPGSGLTVHDAFLGETATPNPAFQWFGAALANITQLGPSFPRSTLVSADAADSDTLSPGTLYASFFHDGKSLDLIQYGFSDSVTVQINDQFFARYGEALTAGTAQGGSLTGIAFADTASIISGFYNEYFVRIVGGTGILGETRQIAAYEGETQTAQISPPWTVAPDSTTQYVVQDASQPFVLGGDNGSINYIHLSWKTAARRKITVEQGIFGGVLADGAISPAPPLFSVPVLIVGDSFWDNEAAPIAIPRLNDTFAASLGWLPTNLGQGGTGFLARFDAGSRLNFQDRIAPPAEGWRIAHTATGGSFSVSVSFGGATATTSTLPFNASRIDVENALNALANLAGFGGFFYVARGDFAAPLIVIGHGMPGATISFNGGNLSGGTLSVLGPYLGDVAANLPRDADGSALPFFLLVSGSGNDTSFSTADLQAAATYTAQQISSRFPTATAIFAGIVGDCNAQTSTVGVADMARNAAIAAGAANLPSINGRTPFIDTYENGLGGLKIINGLGTVADPQPGTNCYFKSITVPGHPTGEGSQFLSDWLATRVKRLLGAAS